MAAGKTAEADIDIAGEVDKPWLARYEQQVPAVVDVPDTALTSLLQRIAGEYGPNVATLFYGERLTYSQVYEQSRRFSAALRTLGLEPGDRVALLLPNSPQFIVTLFGTWGAGGIAVPLNPAMSRQEIAQSLADSGAKVLVALQPHAWWLREVAQGTPVQHVVATGLQDYLSPLMSLVLLMRERRVSTTQQEQAPGEESEIVTHGFLDLIRASEPANDLDPAQARPDDTALILFTEGVTGAPKGVKLTHRNLVSNVSQLAAWVWDSRPERRDVYLSAAPFHSSYGLVAALLLPVWVAGTMAIVPRPTAKELIRTLARCRPNVFPATPALLEGIAEHPLAQRHDLRSLRLCLSYGDRLAHETARAIEGFTGARVVEAYGLAEASAITHCSPIYGESREGSIGLPLPSTDARIIGPDASSVMPPGEPGRLAVGGPQVMEGYWSRPEETEEVLRDGWLLTGDVAWHDADGYFYLAGRESDAISVSGELVYPRQIEAVLLQHDNVAGAMALGAPNPRSGEAEIIAYVVLLDDAETTEHELIQFCSAHLPSYAIPTRIEFRDDLPRSATGKYVRRVVGS